MGGLLLLALVAGIWLVNGRGGEEMPPAGEGAALGAGIDLEATVQARVALALTVETAVQATLTPPSSSQAAIPVTPSPMPTPQPDPVPQPPALADQDWQGFSLPTESLLNLRTGTGDGYDVFAVLPEGLRLRPLGQSEDGAWLFVSLGAESGDGWVAAWLLSFPQDAGEAGSPLDGLPVLEAPPLPTPSPQTEQAERPGPEPGTEAESLAEEAAPTATPDAASSPAGGTFPAGTPLPSDPSHPCLIAGYFWLISPVETGIHNQVSFRWGFSGELPAECGFEVRMWREGQIPTGVHDAVRDNLDGLIKLERQNEYRLDIPFVHNLPSVDGQPGFYEWTVAIVQITPTYQDFGREAPPARIFVNAR
jgi:hypothetical protein